MEVPFKPGWIGEIPSEYLDENFKKILLFYVVKCPRDKASSRGINIKEIWGNNVWGKRILRNKILEVGDLIPKENYLKVNKSDEISNAIAHIKLNGNFHTKLSGNKIVFCKNGEQEIINILYYIRCSFAHGRFTIKKENNIKYYILEATKNRGKIELKSRMILKESTLLDWIDIINNPKLYKDL